MRRWPAVGLLLFCGAGAGAILSIGATGAAPPPHRVVAVAGAGSVARAVDALPPVPGDVVSRPHAPARRHEATRAVSARTGIDGHVVGEDGSAIGGGSVALVRGGRRDAVAPIAGDGSFRFDDDVAGAIELVARPATHAPARIALGPTASRRGIRIRVRRGVALAMTIVDAVRERPQPGVAFVVTDPESGVVRRATSDDAGRLRVVGLPHADADRLRVELDDEAWFVWRDADGGSVRLADGAAELHVVRAVSLEGVVTAAGRPVAGARVHVRVVDRSARVVVPATDAVIDGESVAAALCTETDRAGRYRLVGVPPFTAVSVVVRADGLCGVARALRCRPGVTRVVDVTLAEDRAIAGRVVAADGAPCAAVVWVADRARVVRRIDVDRHGRFSVASMPRGPVRLRAVAADGRDSSAVRARVGGRVVLRLGPPVGPIRGVVVDAHGQPCVAARVELVPCAMPRLFDGEPFTTPTVVCDERGRFAVDRLRGGWRYRVRATAVDGASVESNPCAPGAESLRLVAVHTGRIVVRLDAPVDAEAVIRRGGRIVARADFDAAVATVEAVPAGRLRVEAVGRDGIVFAHRASVDVLPAATVDVTLDPAATRDLPGLAVDGSGRPLAGVPVTTLLSGDVPRRTTTGDDGRFVLRALPAGPRDVAFGDPARGFTIARAVRPGPAIRIVHAPRGRVEVRVHSDRDGRPIGHAVVAFMTAGRAVGRVACDPNGLAAWRVSPGRYAIVATADGHRPAAARLVVGSWGRVAHVALRLAPAH